MSRGTVWTPSLTVPVPIVHLATWPRRERVTERDDGTLRREFRTDCGYGLVGVFEENEHRQITYDTWCGAYLYVEHAQAIGARWCRKCWPRQPVDNRGAT